VKNLMLQPLSLLTRLTRVKLHRTLAACVLVAAGAGSIAHGQAGAPMSSGSDEVAGAQPSEVRGLTVEEQVGASLPLELTFVNSEGKTVRIGDYFKTEAGKGGTASAFSGEAKPTVLMLVYYRCPVVCDVLMSKMTQTFDEIDFDLGKDYNALFFSIDDTEDQRVSSAAKAKYATTYRVGRDAATREQAMQGWQFHTGDADSVNKLAKSVGYQFRKLSNGEFSHPVVAFVITPDGKLSRYLYGFKQEPRDLKLALMEASEGKLVRTIGDRILAFCYMYDPNRGSYSLQAIRVMQLGGLVTLVGLGALVGLLLFGERLRKRAALAGGAGGLSSGLAGLDLSASEEASAKSRGTSVLSKEGNS
jgi:protein SCO1/2